MANDSIYIKQHSGSFDAIVIGSGITGGLAAKELTEKGLTTLMVERGRRVEHQKDYPQEGKAPWEMEFRGQVAPERAKQQEVQSSCYAYTDYTKDFFNNDADAPYSTEDGKPFTWIRGNQLGGKGLLWSRQCYRWSDLDFSANVTDGHGNDWPIRYKDIEPWYDYVEIFAGISGTVEGLPQLPDSKFQPGFELNCLEQLVSDSIDEKFDGRRRMIIGRCAHLTDPTPEQIELGRSKCQSRNQCDRGCSFGAYFNTQNATLPAATRTGKLKIATDSIVHSLIYDEQVNRVTGVRVIDAETSETREYYARVIFLCASTLGSVQILLNSKTDTYPTGLGNSSGVLGHYLMDHTYRAGARGQYEGLQEEYYYGRRPTGIYIPRFRNVTEPSSKFLRGYGFQGSAVREGWDYTTRQQGFGADFKQSIREPGPWKFDLFGFGEMLPRYENSVSLHPQKTDKWGIPQLNLNVSFSDNEARMLDDICDTAAEMLEGAGLINVVKIKAPPMPGACIHEMGGARMGADPRDSFVNSHNQSHDVPNLFITDGSAMASTACQNPSLTFMALTARACDFAVKALRAGEI